MIKAILSPFKNFAWFKRMNAKVSYELLAKYIPAEDWHFMNYGYMPAPGEPAMTNENRPDTQYYPMQMYYCLARKIELAGKDVLEVGSGRGGGARLITTSLQPRSYTGLDLAHNAVRLAKKIHPLPGLDFIQGSAEAIPMADESVDAVINVESCHAYGSVPTFLGEVRRVLRPGGHLLLVDFRYTHQVDEFFTHLAESGLRMISKEDITAAVVRAIEAEDDVKTARIRKLFPRKSQKLFSEFAGVAGSKFHRNLVDRDRLYYRFVLQKSE